MQKCAVKTVEDCFRDISNIDAWYGRAKGYSKDNFNTPEATMITEVKTTEESGLCYKCGDPN